MSYCVRIAGGEGRWLVVTPQDTRGRVDGVRLVTEAPEFLGLLEPSGPMPRAAIVAPGSNSGRVVLAVSDNGRVRLVACPDKADEAELSGLMADLLSTSGRFWRQGYAVLAGPFQQQLGASLEEYVGARAPKGWTAPAFKAGVEKSLQDGRFPVTVLTNDSGKPLQDMLGYLRNMNLEVAVLGYLCARGEGIEAVVPVSLAHGGSESRPAPRSEAMPERRPEPTAERPVQGQVAHGEQHTQTVTFSTRRPQAPTVAGEPFSADGTSPEQQRILASLVQLDELGLVRSGWEYFAPGYERRESAEGTIVVAVDENRWPFPKPDEVVVVVNIGLDHLAGYLRLSSEEIEEFLGSLPRVRRKEHRGAVLLRASNVQEAEQLVNELRALKEVAGTGV
ncbi:MAG: hypothetical protein R6X14_00605 [bacterium]